MMVHLNGIKEIIPEGMTIKTLIEWAKEEYKKWNIMKKIR